MPRPNRLKIQGRRVRLSYLTPVTHPKWPDEALQGVWLGSENRIEIDSDLAPDEMRATATHEVVHDLESIAGLALSEAQVAAFSTILFSFIRDNPKFVAWLQEKG